MCGNRRTGLVGPFGNDVACRMGSANGRAIKRIQVRQPSLRRVPGLLASVPANDGTTGASASPDLPPGPTLGWWAEYHVGLRIVERQVVSAASFYEVRQHLVGVRPANVESARGDRS